MKDRFLALLLVGLTKKLNSTENGCIELDNANESSINLILMSLFVIDDVDVNVGVDKDDVDAVAVVVVFSLQLLHLLMSFWTPRRLGRYFGFWYSIKKVK